MKKVPINNFTRLLVVLRMFWSDQTARRGFIGIFLFLFWLSFVLVGIAADIDDISSMFGWFTDDPLPLIKPNP